MPTARWCQQTSLDFRLGYAHCASQEGGQEVTAPQYRLSRFLLETDFWYKLSHYSK